MGDELPRVLSEESLSISDAAKICGVDPVTVRAWARTGVPAGGQTVRLEAVRVGVKWRTSRQALARFVAATTNPVRPEPIASPAELDRRAEKAKKQLRSLGVAC